VRSIPRGWSIRSAAEAPSSLTDANSKAEIEDPFIPVVCATINFALRTPKGSNDHSLCCESDHAPSFEKDMSVEYCLSSHR